jgi:hypothetical protein
VVMQNKAARPRGGGRWESLADASGFQAAGTSRRAFPTARDPGTKFGHC